MSFVFLIIFFGWIVSCSSVDGLEHQKPCTSVLHNTSLLHRINTSTFDRYDMIRPTNRNSSSRPRLLGSRHNTPGKWIRISRTISVETGIDDLGPVHKNHAQDHCDDTESRHQQGRKEEAYGSFTLECLLLAEACCIEHSSKQEGWRTMSISSLFLGFVIIHTTNNQTREH